MPYAFGNKIVWDNGTLQYIIFATGEVLNDETRKDLVCPKCGKKQTPEGHDPCIPNLPGVDFACCGHGIKKGYVKFTNGIILTGEFNHCQSLVGILGGELPG